MEIITAAEARERGLKRYYTGKPCKRGHYSERHVSGPCYACAKEDYKNKWGPAERARNAKNKIDRIEKQRKETEDFCKANNVTFLTASEAKSIGAPRYFDGVKCKRGHLSERFTRSHHCVECGKVRSKKYVEENSEKRKKSVLKYSSKPESKIKRRQNQERLLRENPNYYKERYAEYRVRLLEDVDRYENLKRKAREYASLPEVRERSVNRARERRRTNSAVRIEQNIKTQLRRSRVRQATPDWLDTSLLSPFYSCAMEKTQKSKTSFSVDHFYPIKSEIVCGLNVPWNLRIISWKENSAKHNRMPEDFYGDQFHEKLSLCGTLF